MSDNRPPSPYWPRIAGLQPRLRAHARILRQEARGRLWYVLEDRVNGRHHRFSPAAYLVIGLLDGERTVEQALEIARRRLGENAPGPEDVVRLLATLHSADALVGSMPADTEEIWRRGAQQQRRKRWMQLRSPLAIRIPLLDPERVLTRLRGIGEAFFSLPAFLVWLATVTVALVLAGLHWTELTGNLVDRALSTENLLLMGVVFPGLKLLHELGHGLAVKRWDGEVHEMGIMFLVFVPVPYVDASSATGFHRRRRQAAVAAAGMYVELFVAALAMIAWAHLEPGLARSVAFSTILIGSATTVLFNANPLLRFDGYFILSDALGIANLGQRASRQFIYLVQRYLLGASEAQSPATDEGEARWLLLYAVSSFVYRLFLISAIAMAVAQRFFFLGAGLALWVAASYVLTPAYGVVRYLSTRVSGPRRRRGIAVAAGSVALVAGLLFGLRLPLATQTEGVVWVPEEAEVVAGADGFVQAVIVAPGAAVAAGDTLLRMEAPGLTTQIRAAEARLTALRARRQAQRVDDLVDAEVTRQEIDFQSARLADLRSRAAALTVRSPTDGRAVILREADLPGEFVPRGTVLGYVVDEADSARVRAVVRQDDIGLLRAGVERVDARLAGHLSEPVRGRLLRQVPTATRSLPSLALSPPGGGSIALDPTAPAQGLALREHFQVEIALAEPARRARMGERAYVRFLHGYEPAGLQLYRRTRQAFLRRLNL